MPRRIFRLAAILLVATAAAAPAQERFIFDIESGAAVSGNTDVRIAGHTGTRFSLTGDLTSATAVFYRLRGELRVAPKHVVSVLAAPQGRAEDVCAGVLVPLGRRFSIKAGYRLLEGGADNDEVHTFAAIHYLAVGAVVRF